MNQPSVLLGRYRNAKTMSYQHSYDALFIRNKIRMVMSLEKLFFQQQQLQVTLRFLSLSLSRLLINRRQPNSGS
jgi:hypothetical protein